MLQNIKPLFFLLPLLAIGFYGWRTLITREAGRWVPPRFAVVILLPAVGLLAPNIYAYYAAIALAMLAVPRTRAEAAGLFILIAFTLPSSALWLESGGKRLIELDTTRIAALALIPAWRFPAGGAIRGGEKVFVALGLAVAGAMLLVDIRTEGSGLPFYTRFVFEHTATLIIPFLFFVSSGLNSTDERRPLFYLIMVGFMLSIVAAFEMLRHWPLYQTIDSNLGTRFGLSKTMAIRGGFLRSPGPFNESTTFGLFLALTTVSILAMRSAFRAPWAHNVAIALGCVGILAALARNAWIGLILGMLIVALYRGRRTLALVICGAAAIGSLVVNFAPADGTLGALAGKSGHAAMTADYREKLFEYSMPIFRRSPIVGTPLDKLREEMRSELRSRTLSVDFVNSYLYFALTNGVPGLLLFMLLFFYPLTRLLRHRRLALHSGPDADVATALAGAIAGLAVMMFFTSYYERVPLLSLLLLAMTRQVVGRLRTRSKRESPDGLRPRRKPLVLDIAS